ncbi:MAG TPA: hypothetical protein VMK05_10415 [Burkholderiales bacterium]|nr:hypothetical protein [Burkholderiales bacterium]
MEAEIKTLEVKLDELVRLCQQLRADNKRLRQQLAQAVNDNKQLSEKISGAKSSLEVLLTRIPEGEQ